MHMPIRWRMTRIAIRFAIAASLFSTAMIAWGAGVIAQRLALERFRTQITADAMLRQSLLASEIARFRLLPRALADDRDVVAALASPGPAAFARLNRKLAALAAEVRAPVIYVIDRQGRTIGASNWQTPASFVGRNYWFRPYFQDALGSGAGEQFALGNVSGRPGLYLATRAARLGVVVVKLEFDAIEARWQQAPGITFVTDRNGVILVSSRPRWRFAATRPLAAHVRRSEEQTSGVSAIARAPFRQDGSDRVVPLGENQPYLLASTPPDAAQWHVNLALPLRPNVDVAVRSAQIVSGLVALILFAVAIFLLERARQRQTRTTQLEAAVAERTAALRNEMTERAAAEQKAAQLREGLRQANRLATLGQVTASVAHETAQPVAAIRNYAASSSLLLDRGDHDAVRGNLAAISRLADRIGTVTAQLRGFARKGSGSIASVSIDEVVQGTRLILREQLARVPLAIVRHDRALMVRGERVRLEQVLVNLVQNALEALHDTPAPSIEISIEGRADTVVVTVADNGPGIDPAIAPVLFTPFATSRANGLGLGLVIAKDIVEEFGGQLALQPGAAGAAFAVTLVRSR